jgi:hypothetical protein
MIERTIRFLTRRALALPLLCVLTSCASFYSSRPSTASVVDAETDQPIAGVVVAATWTLSGKEPSNLVPSDVLYMTDTLTDATGHFTMPAVGPIRLPYAEIAPSRRALDYAEPHIYLYKPGYRYTIVTGSVPPSGGYKGFLTAHTLPLAVPWWHDRVFRLQRFIGRPDESIERLEMLPLRHCRWVELPHMAAAYIAETVRLQKLSQSRPREITQELLHESCPNAEHPLTDNLR